MKGYVLYSGGKDSSLIAVLLKRLGIDVKLVTANFGVHDSFISAQNSAKALGIKHIVLNLNKTLLKEAVTIILNDGFLNNGISYLHKVAIEEVSDLANKNQYSIVSDGTRRDDRTPKLNKDEIKSLEDRKNVQYINLDSFGHKTIEYLVSKIFKLTYEESTENNSSDYEVEIRALINNKKHRNLKISFPKHYQTRVFGFKTQNQY